MKLTLFYLTLFFVGTCTSSFIYCQVYRNTHNTKNTLFSKCDHCNHQLFFTDLVPIFSYLFLKGKCRYCNEKINNKNLIYELIGGVLFLTITIKCGISISAIKYLILVIILLFISFYDIEIMEIPNELIVIGLINNCVFSLSFYTFVYNMLNSFCISVIVFIISLIMKKEKNKDVIGGGDIKLIFMLSSYLVFKKCLISIITACLMGIIYIIKNKMENIYIAFGPFLSLGYILIIIANA